MLPRCEQKASLNPSCLSLWILTLCDLKRASARCESPVCFARSPMTRVSYTRLLQSERSALCRSTFPRSDFPRAPLPALCAIAAPAVFAVYSPDTFDTFSVGVILLQLSLGPLRGREAVRRLQSELANEGNDLDKWRERGGLAARCDFDALDKVRRVGLSR